MEMPPTAITTRAEFGAALAFVVGQSLAAREMWLVDRDFAAWPLDDTALLDALTRWARQPQRKLTLVGYGFDDVPRRHPRFTAWRRTWSHVVDARAVPELDPSEVPTLLLAGELGVQLFDREHARGHWFADETTWRTWREVVDALLQRSESSFGASTLGL
jgi:hypothetical protein